MKIRSITCFLNPGSPLDTARLQSAGDFRLLAIQAYEAAGYEVQTTRLATPPFSTLLPGRVTPSGLQSLAQELEATAAQAGFAYVSLGPALPEVPESYACIPAAVSATQNVFLAGALTNAQGQVDMAAVHRCAEVIHALAPISADGFANLRFAALANVPPGSPFFPAAYRHPDVDISQAHPHLTFALATEAAVLAVQAFDQAKSLAQARQSLVETVEAHASRLEQVSAALAQQCGVGFGGIDFSLAPFPQRDRSLGEAMQRMGVPEVGQPGSLAAAAILAEAVDRARFARVGFSGLFLPVLEDAVLAQRAAETLLAVKDLLLYSAVCGTGLDTIPLPGDTSVESLYALLLDVAVLSTRLNKPLTARLLPVPGKRAGDPTGFDFAFFANSRVMALDAQPLTGVLAGDESFRLITRKPA